MSITVSRDSFEFEKMNFSDINSLIFTLILSLYITSIIYSNTAQLYSISINMLTCSKCPFLSPSCPLSVHYGICSVILLYKTRWNYQKELATRSLYSTRIVWKNPNEPREHVVTYVSLVLINIQFKTFHILHVVRYTGI